MKKLIISYSTYSWIKYCSGMIIQEPNTFSVMIVMAEKDKPIYGCANLCKAAIYEQRSEDLYNIGIKIGVKELTNFRNTIETFDIHKLIAQLQLKIMLGGIEEIYYQKSKLLDIIFNKMNKKLCVNIYSYGKNGDKVIELSQNEYSKKLSLKEFMIGKSNLLDIEDWKNKEVFEKLV